MVPDRQKVRKDGRTHKRSQNYIPPTLSGEKKSHFLSDKLSIYILIILKMFITAVVFNEKNQKFFDN